MSTTLRRHRERQRRRSRVGSFVNRDAGGGVPQLMNAVLFESCIFLLLLHQVLTNAASRRRRTICLRMSSPVSLHRRVLCGWPRIPRPRKRQQSSFDRYYVLLWSDIEKSWRNSSTMSMLRIRQKKTCGTLVDRKEKGWLVWVNIRLWNLGVWSGESCVWKLAVSTNAGQTCAIPTQIITKLVTSTSKLSEYRCKLAEFQLWLNQNEGRH